MPTRITDAAQNAATNAVVDLIDGGAGTNGTMEIRSGPQPADADDVDAGTLLATVTLQNPAFGNAVAGTATANGLPLTTTGSADGTAGHVRFKNTDGVTVADGDVTATGGGGDVELNTTTISTGVDVEITNLTFTAPASE